MTDQTTGEGRISLREHAKRRTAAKVLKAARSEFEAHGYEATTIRAIARAAGMSTGAVFANYVGKAELYQAAFGHPPITPEIGRQALRGLQAFQIANGLRDTDAMLRAFRFADDILALAKFPAAATPTGRSPGDALRRFIEGEELGSRPSGPDG